MTDPAAPRRLPDTDPALGHVLAVESDWLVSWREDHGEEQPDLIVSDIADPVHPQAISTLAVAGPPMGLAIAGSLGVLSTFGDECSLIQIIDFSNRLAPVLRGQWRPEYNASAIAVRGRRAFIATDGGECDAIGADLGTLTVLDLSNPDLPGPMGTLQFDRSAFGMAVAEPFAYVALWDHGLAIVDVANPQAPTVVGHLDVPGLAHDVVVDGGRAYVASYDPSQANPASAWWPWHDRWGGVVVADVSNPAAPRVIGHLATGAPGQLAVHDGTLWLASAASGLWAWR